MNNLTSADSISAVFMESEEFRDSPLCPLFTLCSIYAGDAISSDDLSGEKAIPVYGSNGIRSYADKANHLEDQVLVGRQGSVGTVHFAEAPFWAAEHALIVEPRTPRVSKSWLKYVLEAMDLSRLSRAVAQPGINATSVSFQRVPHIPFEQQKVIGDYLDRETAEIDAAVADLDKYVELLEKRRTLRLIEETRIRSSARMTTIGRHAQVSLGKTLQSEQKSQNEQLVNYVRAGNIQPNGVFDGEAKQMWMTPDEQSAYSLLPGDVLVVEGGAGFGRSLTLNLGLQGWGFQNHVIRIRPQSGWIGKFIDYSIRAHKTDGLIDLLAVGATIPGFSADKARNLPIAFLTEREQSEVVQTLDKDMDEIDSLIAESTRLRDLLLKRRSVLITEVVTGRKRV